LEYANWYLTETGTQANYKDIHEVIAQFKSSFIYIKKFELEYGKELISLCQKLENVFY